MKPERSYRCSRSNRAFFQQIWSPQETVLEVGGLEHLGDLDPEIHNKSIFHSEDLFPKLEKYFSRCSFHPEQASYQRAFAITKDIFTLNRKVFAVRQQQEVLKLLKLDRNSGAPFFIKKGESFYEDWENSKKIVAGRSPPPCVAFKRLQHGDEGPKTRLVWGYPQSMTILESKYAAPLIKAYSLYRKDTLPYFSRKVTLGSNLTRFENRNVRYGIDYSGFDSTVPRELIIMAFDILKSNIADIDESEWDAIVRYFCYTSIVMPDMMVYRKVRGIPSGSYFTQLIGSIVNYFSIIYAFDRLGVELHPKNVMVLGDDSLVAPADWVPVARLAHVLTELNLKVNREKTSITRRTEPIEFLGHYWPLGLPDREFEEVLKRVRFPERWEALNQKPEERIAAFMADAVSTWSLWNKWVYRIHLDTIEQRFPRIRKGIDVSHETGLSKLLGPPSKSGFVLATIGPLL